MHHAFLTPHFVESLQAVGAHTRKIILTSELHLCTQLVSHNKLWKGPQQIRRQDKYTTSCLQEEKGNLNLPNQHLTMIQISHSTTYGVQHVGAIENQHMLACCCSRVCLRTCCPAGSNRYLPISWSAMTCSRSRVLASRFSVENLARFGASVSISAVL